MVFTAKAHGWRQAALIAMTASSVVGITTNASAQQSGATNTPNTTQQIGEVVVTASRRELSVRKTPIAISAYSGQELQKEHVETFSDLTTQSPNIQLGTNGGNTDIAIRGIGTDLQTAGNDPGVAFYVDGIYLSDPALALLTFLDVNRVEVLRGPQGTLFGRNATGGGVNVVSNAPTLQPTFGFDAFAGSPAGEHIDAFASGPLNSDGTLLGRAAFEQTYQQGDVKDVDPAGPRRLDDKNNYAGRLQLEWRPTSFFSARLLLDYQNSDTAGPPYYLVGTVNAPLPPQLANTFIGTPGDDKIAADQGAAKLTEDGAALFLNWNIGGGSLKATISTRHTYNYRLYDGEGTAVVYDNDLVDEKHDTSTFELLYSSDDRQRFSFILGTNYLFDRETETISVYVPYVLPPPIVSGGNVDTNSAAVFGHAQYKLTDAWKFFGGARYSADFKRLGEFNNLIGTQTRSDSWAKPTFEIGTSYDLDRTTTAYLKYATGYKSGGYSAGAFAPPFNPETDGMWELGVKGSYFKGKLEANLALFTMAYQNLQVYQIAGLNSIVTNAAKASINGVELELVQHLTPELRIVFEGGWLDARFDQFLSEDSARPSLGELNLADNTLPNAPNFTAGGGPVYTHPLANGGTLTLATRYDWKSRLYFSEFNLPLVSQGAAGRVNAYANYDLPGGHWQVGLYGRNLTDALTYSSKLVYSTVLNSSVVGTLEPRREFGAELHYRY